MDGRRDAGSIWTTPRAIGLHVTVAVVVPVMLGLCAWQVDRALSGNGLSWAYVFEWPFFAGYAVYMWWKLVHEPRGKGAGEVAPAGAEAAAAPQVELSRTASASSAPEADPAAGEPDELAAYNRYLAELDAQGDRRRW